MKAEVLGIQLNVVGFAVAGRPSKESLALILREIVSLIGMDTAGMQPIILAYPLPTGQGSTGETIFQPLVESFIISDSYPGLDKVYIVLASCKPFDSDVVAGYLEWKIGAVLSQGNFILR